MGKGMGRKPKERESVVERQKKLRQKEDQNVSISEVGQAVIDTSKIGSVDEVHEYSHNMIMRNNVFQQNRSVYRKDLQSINKEMRRQKRLSRRKRFRDNFSTIIKVFKYSKKYQYLLWLTIFFDLFCIFLELCIPVVLGKAIDCIVGKNNVDFSSLLNYSVLMCGLIAFAGIGKWAEAVCTNLYCIKTSKSVRELMFNKFNHVPLAVIDNHQHGDLLDRMVNDVEDMTNGFLSSIQAIFSGIVTIIGTIVFMFVLNTSMAFIIILVTPLSLLFTVFIARKSKKLFNRMAKAQGDISGHMEEYFSGQRIVKAFGHEEAAINEYDEINKEFYIVSEKAQFLSKLIGPITRFINGLVYGLVGLFGSIFAIRGMMSVGMISSFLTYSNSYGRPFSDIADQISDIQEAFAAARRIFEILEKKNEPSDEGLFELDKADGTLELKNVCFSYVPKQKLIQNLNLKVQPGQKIAIVGPTGCGKSTLINLLMRFYDINSGEIVFSGYNVYKMTRASLRTKYGMVLQESWLFSGTVFSNIAYGKQNATYEEVVQAAKMAGAHDFIVKMKDGYNTKIEDGGSNVSQGQKQLLCIARIMLLKPPLLILDEATSNIDTHTEIKIQEAFNTIMKGRTSFIIAHRLSTITNADVILVMNKGNVIEKGKHDELMQKRGFYYHLYQSQFN